MVECVCSKGVSCSIFSEEDAEKVGMTLEEELACFHLKPRADREAGRPRGCQ